MRNKFIACASISTLAAVVSLADAGRSYAADADTAGQVADSIETVTVVAERREESLQNVPISVTALSADQIAKSQVYNNQDLDALTPGLVTTSVSGASQMYIRGVGSQSTTPGTESSVATYIDGVYIASINGAVFGLNNIDHIEVDRGPQGTLFGRNATGGVIQILTRKPQFDPTLDADFSYGSYNIARGNLYVSGGLTDEIAGNLSVYFTHQGDSFGHNQYAGNPQDLNYNNEFNGRGQILIQPSEKFSLLLSADYDNQNNDMGINRQPLTGTRNILGGTRVGGPFDGDYNYYSAARNIQYGFSGVANIDLGFAVLKNITALRQYTWDETYDQDTTPLSIVNVDHHNLNRTVQQEVLLQGSTHGLDWTVGAFYLDYLAELRPLSSAAAPVSSTNVARYTTDDTQSYAGYAQGTYAVTDNFKLTAGIRYTKDSSVLNGSLVALPGNPSPAGTVLININNKELNSDKLTWRFAGNWQITQDTMAYISATRGFKSGQFNTTSIQQLPTRPETLDSYEIGLKTDFLDHRLRLDASAFHYNYKDIQLVEVAPPPINIQTLNAASAKENGAEFELTALPIVDNMQHLQLGASLTLLDAHYTSFENAPYFVPQPYTAPPPGVTCSAPSSAAAGGNASCKYDASGAKMIRSPKWTMGASVDYVLNIGPGEVELNSNVFHSDGFYWEDSNRTRQAPYTVWNGEISFRPEGTSWEFGIFGRNLTNELYYSSVSEQALGDLATAQPPRTYGFELHYHWG